VDNAQRTRWKNQLASQDLKLRKQATAEMVQRGLYVFGGHHTQQTLAKLQNADPDLMPESYREIRDRPEIWWEWPALIIALPDTFTDNVQWLDVCSEFDNEPIALTPTFLDRILKLRNRWLAKFKTVDGFRKAKEARQVADWMRSMQVASAHGGSSGQFAQWVNLVAQPLTCGNATKS
jgi:hypothetical protein